MSLFGKKKEVLKEVKTDGKKKSTEKSELVGMKNVPSAPTRGVTSQEIIRRPRITEKATMLAEVGAYVFEVHARATKSTVRQAVSERFGVTVRKVRMIPIPTKRRMDRASGKASQVSGGTKAVVFLKKGDKIEFV